MIIIIGQIWARKAKTKQKTKQKNKQKKTKKTKKTKKMTIHPQPQMSWTMFYPPTPTDKTLILGNVPQSRNLVGMAAKHICFFPLPPIPLFLLLFFFLWPLIRWLSSFVVGVGVVVVVVVVGKLMLTVMFVWLKCGHGVGWLGLFPSALLHCTDKWSDGPFCFILFQITQLQWKPLIPCWWCASDVILIGCCLHWSLLDIWP